MILNKRLRIYKMVNKIKKRDGKIVDFVPEKIRVVAEKALLADGFEEEKAYLISQRVCDKVVTRLDMMFNGVSSPTVEQTQDLVEDAMMGLGDEYHSAAKRFIIYREAHKERREMDAGKKAVVDFARRLMGGYIDGSDWRGKENANSGQITFQGANARAAGEIMNLVALEEMYGKENPEISEAHKTGQFHIHDLDFPIVGYCCGHSLENTILRRGFGEVKERVQSRPPKHLRSAISQMVNYIGTMQGEFAGAQAFVSVDTYLAPFVKADNLSDREVEQSMQELIYGLNVPSRWGWQAPFSNLGFDLTVPKDLAEKSAIIGGKEVDFTYGDVQPEMDRINKAYIEEKMRGDKSGRIFTFPIDTYNLTSDFNWDSEVANLLFEVTGKYGIPYFSNYIHSDLNPSDIRAMCCRLRLDLRELRSRGGGLFGSNPSTGSIGVVTINMNRIGYESHSEGEFFKLLEHRMDLAEQSLEIKRKTIVRLLEQKPDSFVPFTKSYIGTFHNHFSTIGLIGMHESMVNFLGKGIETEEGKKFAVKTLEFMRGKMQDYQEKTGNLYNLEATPGEGTCYRLAKLDKETYPNIYTSGDSAPYLTNSTQLPVDLDIDLFSALKHQESLQGLYTGGTIFHTFLGERLSGEDAKNLVKKIATETTLPYFSLTPVFSVCAEHGYISGREEQCPTCKNPTEIYDRVVGYIRPVNSFNPGKKSEFGLRKRFKI
ncbi:Vitamin B12-dependent ribonucleoside-diphosphate reductase [uncultured archaeon]|nr:Vitamin B12-dependent ribonucleoside-diphosphate reductase [uncultured archaeon]